MERGFVCAQNILYEAELRRIKHNNNKSTLSNFSILISSEF